MGARHVRTLYALFVGWTNCRVFSSDTLLAYYSSSALPFRSLSFFHFFHAESASNLRRRKFNSKSRLNELYKAFPSRPPLGDNYAINYDNSGSANVATFRASISRGRFSRVNNGRMHDRSFSVWNLMKRTTARVERINYPFICVSFDGIIELAMDGRGWRRAGLIKRIGSSGISCPRDHFLPASSRVSQNYYRSRLRITRPRCVWM